MKKSLTFLTQLLVVALLFTGCTQEEYTEAISDEIVTMNLSITTHADNDINVIGREEGIYKVYVFIFKDSGKEGEDDKMILENGNDRILTSDGTQSILQCAWRVSRTAKKVYIVANPHTVELEAALNAVNNYAELKAITTDKVHEPSFNGMLMCGEKDITVGDIKNKQSVSVKRRAGRIKLTLKQDGEWGESTLVVQSVTLSARKTKTGLMDDILDRETDVDAPTVTHTPNLTIGKSATETAVFYHYVMPTPTKKADYLTINVLVGGVPKSYTAYIAIDNDESQPVPYQANQCINIDATVEKAELKIKVSVVDWEPITINSDLGKYVKYTAVTHEGGPDEIDDGTYDLGELGTTLKIHYESNVAGYVQAFGVEDGSVLSESIVLPVAKGGGRGGVVDLKVNKLLGYETHLKVSVRVFDHTGAQVDTIPFLQKGGFLPNWLLKEKGWNVDLPKRGLFLAKKGGYTQNDANFDPDGNDYEGEITISYWEPRNDNIETSINYGKGYENTSLMENSGGGTTKSNIAKYCRNLGRDWYVPSKYEFETVLQCLDYIGLSYTLEIDQGYWSSSQNNQSSAWGIKILEDNLFTEVIEKSSGKLFRCVINEPPVTRL